MEYVIQYSRVVAQHISLPCVEVAAFAGHGGQACRYNDDSPTHSNLR